VIIICCEEACLEVFLNEIKIYKKAFMVSLRTDEDMVGIQTLVGI